MEPISARRAWEHSPLQTHRSTCQIPCRQREMAVSYLWMCYEIMGFTRRSGVSATFAKTTVHTSNIHFVCPPIFTGTFPIFAQVNETQRFSVSSVLLETQFSSTAYRARQCSTCIKLHDYKLVVKHPKRPPHPQTSASPPSFQPNQLPILLLRGSPSTAESNCGFLLHSPLLQN